MSDDNVIDINSGIETEPNVLEPTHEEVIGFLRTLDYLRSLSWFEEGNVSFGADHINIELTRFINEEDPTEALTKYQTLKESLETDFFTVEIDTLVYDIQDMFKEFEQREEDDEE